MRDISIQTFLEETLDGNLIEGISKHRSVSSETFKCLQHEFKKAVGGYPKIILPAKILLLFSSKMFV